MKGDISDKTIKKFGFFSIFLLQPVNNAIFATLGFVSIFLLRTFPNTPNFVNDGLAVGLLGIVIIISFGINVAVSTIRAKPLNSIFDWRFIAGVVVSSLISITYLRTISGTIGVDQLFVPYYFCLVTWVLLLNYIQRQNTPELYK